MHRCAQVYRQVAVLTWQVSLASMGTTPWSVITARFSSSLAIYSTYLYRCAQVYTGVQAGSSTHVAGEPGQHGHDAVVSDHGKVLLVTGDTSDRSAYAGQDVDAVGFQQRHYQLQTADETAHHLARVLRAHTNNHSSRVWMDI